MENRLPSCPKTRSTKSFAMFEPCRAERQDIPNNRVRNCGCAGTNRRDAMGEEAIRRRSSEPLRPRVMRRPVRECSAEALTGARAGWDIEARKCVSLPGADVVCNCGRPRPHRRHRETMRDPVRSETPRCTEASRTGAGRLRAGLPLGWRQTARGSPRADG